MKCYLLAAAYNLRALVNYRLQEANQDVRYEMAMLVSRITNQLRSVENSVNALADVVQNFDGSRKELQTYLKNIIQTHPEISSGAILISRAWRDANNLKPCDKKE